MGSCYKNEVPQHLILDYKLFLIDNDDLPDDCICNIATVYVLMILLYTLNGIRYLICGSNSSWFLNLNLTYKTLWIRAGSGFLISKNSTCFVSLSQLLKLPPRKLGSWFVLWSFFLQMLLCISINLPYDLAWITFIMSGQVHRIASPSSSKCSQLMSFL